MIEDPYKRAGPFLRCSVRLWSINRVLQFTGFRLGVHVARGANGEAGPITLGLSWYGFKNFGTWGGPFP